MSQIVGPGSSKQVTYAKPQPIRLLVLAPSLAVLALLVAAAAITPGNFFVNLLGFAFGLPITAAWGALSAFSVAGGALNAAFSMALAGAVVPAIAAGVAAGLAIALAQRLHWLPGGARLKRTVASTVASREFWVGGVVDSARLLATNLATAYVVSAILTALGVFASAETYAAALDHVTAAGGHGGFDTLSFDSALYALFFALGLALCLGAIGGFASGAAVGALFGGLSWTGLGVAAVQGAAKGFTLSAFSVPEKGRRGGFLRRIALAALHGGLTGAMGGAFVAVLLCALQLLTAG
ncbi:MAG TPA: hypothetical protein VEA80_04545 [Vitreimonas sp.]|uniref:hypothetical protein n=1 Tax=Vitreimonas sp. TaxID=3069702 RepID=UPI002D2B7CDE|nr:hypothetical protein [Vitreimonas sp.]HYD86722.1 hypothetical protein [Vitreimonas sp.]